MKTEGWKAFLAWALVGGLYGFAVLSAMSIGMFVLLVAIGATLFAALEVRAWPEIFGMAVGPAPPLVFLAWRLNKWPVGVVGLATAIAGLIAYLAVKRARPR